MNAVWGRYLSLSTLIFFLTVIAPLTTSASTIWSSIMVHPDEVALLTQGLPGWYGGTSFSPAIKVGTWNQPNATTTTSTTVHFWARGNGIFSQLLEVMLLPINEGGNALDSSKNILNHQGTGLSIVIVNATSSLQEYSVPTVIGKVISNSTGPINMWAFFQPAFAPSGANHWLGSSGALPYVEICEGACTGSNTPPTITLLGSTATIIEIGTTFTDPGATAHDDTDGTITNLIHVTGSLNTNSIGTSTLVYVVTNSQGISASTTRTVLITCTVNCYSNILFLPGMEGSKLSDESTGSEVWLPTDDSVAETLRMDAVGTSTNLNITATEAIDHANLGQFDHAVYQSFLNEMKDWQTLYGITATTTPYDWRLDLNTLVSNGKKLPNGHISYTQAPDPGHDAYLTETLKQLAATSKTGKVTIVAHSNGGFVAKALMQKLGDATTSQLIDRVIFVDVPQVGTPQAIGGLLHGDGTSISKYIIGNAISSAEARKLGQNMPVAYNQLPTNGYFTFTDNPVVTFDPTTMSDWISKYGDVSNPTVGIHSVELLKKFMTDSSGFRSKPVFTDTVTPEIVNSNLFDTSISAHTSLDTWTPPAGVQLFTIAGWGNPTMAGINYERLPQLSCDFVNSTPGFIQPSHCSTSTSITYTPKLVIDGDGTVVESSAQWAAGASSTRYWVNLLDYNRPLPENSPLNALRTGHVEILEVNAVRDLLLNIMKDGSSAQLPNKYISTSRPVYDGSDPRLHFTLHSPLTLGFTTPDGSYTGSTPTTTLFSIPGVDYERFGEIQWLSVPKSMAGKVTMHGTGTGSFALDVESVNGNDVLATTTFAAVLSSTSTIATLNIDPSVSPTASSTLNVDFNGDGIIDSTLKAKEGSVVLPDTTPPQIQLLFSTSTHSLVYAATDDSGSVMSTSTTTLPLKNKKGTNATTATTTISATDPTGNTTVLTYTQQSSTPNGNQQLNATLTSITYNGITTPITTTILSYLFKLEDTNSFDLFASYVKAGTTTLESHFLPDTNQTVFMTNPQPLTNDDVGERAIKRRLSGLIVPFLKTNGGVTVVGY